MGVQVVHLCGITHWRKVNSSCPHIPGGSLTLWVSPRFILHDPKCPRAHLESYTNVKGWPTFPGGGERPRWLLKLARYSGLVKR